MEEIFSENSDASSEHVRKLIREHNLKPYVCAVCKIDTWNDVPINLQLDHIYGNRKDNRLESLRWICPNCHSQTPTFCSKNKRARRYSDEQIISLCRKHKNVRGVVLELGCNARLYGRIKKLAEANNIVFEQPYGTGRITRPKNVASGFSNKKKSDEWNKKIGFSNRRRTWPTKEQLSELIEKFPVETLGTRFGVSGNAVRKWCKFYNIETKPVGYWTIKHTNAENS